MEFVYEGETDRQAQMRRGRKVEEMSADDRLEYANAAAPPGKAGKARQDGADVAMTPAAREYLGDREIASLSTLDRENLDFLNKLGTKTRLTPDFPDLDASKLESESAEFRLAVAENHARLRQASAERHLPPEVRKISADEMEKLRLRVGPFLVST